MHQEDGFDWRVSVTREKCVNKTVVETGLGQLRRFAAHPFGGQFAVVKTHAPKLPRVAEDERAFLLTKHNVVVLVRPEIRRLDA